MTTHSTIQDATLEVAKSAPPVAVSGLTLAGIQLSDLVLLATLAWIGLQAGFFLYDRLLQRRERLARLERERLQCERGPQA